MPVKRVHEYDLKAYLRYVGNVSVFSEIRSAVERRPSEYTAGRYFIAGIVLNLPACKSITSRRARMF